jgi:hypothetical protein
LSADVLGLAALEPVSLPDVVAAASLQHRVDRKYLVPLEIAEALVDAVSVGHRVLEIDERRTTTYRSTYVDTADLRSCRDHLQGRRRRWKARSRLYVEDGLCRFEVKVRGGRGDTVKHAVELPAAAYGGYAELQRDFVADVLGTAPELLPVLEVGYTRATLADLDAGTRLTIDLGVTGRAVPGGPQRLTPGEVAFTEDSVIVETKGTARLAAADRVLFALGYRPRPLSKYATSVAFLSDLPDNDVRRLAGRHVRLHPRPDASSESATERHAS